MAAPAPPRKVFVTGANGFIGRVLVERLRALGSEVSGVDLRQGDDPAVVQGDMSAPGLWQRHAEGSNVVVHTAALVGMYSSARGYWESNVMAPRLALDAAIAAGAGRFVHLSSIVVFGFDFDGEVDERTPVHPNGVHYVDTKIASLEAQVTSDVQQLAKLDAEVLVGQHFALLRFLPSVPRAMAFLM